MGRDLAGDVYVDERLHQYDGATHMPDKLCPWEKLYKRRATSLHLPFMMPGFRHRNRRNKTASKGERCFYLNTDNDHSSTTQNILLSLGVCSCSAAVTCVYRRAPFVGEVPTWGGGSVVDASAAALAGKLAVATVTGGGGRGSRRIDISGAFALLEADEQIIRLLATGPAVDGDPELPAALACASETPKAYARAHLGAADRKGFAGHSSTGTFKQAREEWQRGANIITAKCVYTWKTDKFGRVVRAKSSLVARGFTEREGVDFFERFIRARQLPVSVC